jgi:hypothetical protein
VQSTLVPFISFQNSVLLKNKAHPHWVRFHKIGIISYIPIFAGLCNPYFFLKGFVRMSLIRESPFDPVL